MWGIHEAWTTDDQDTKVVKAKAVNRKDPPPACRDRASDNSQSRSFWRSAIISYHYHSLDSNSPATQRNSLPVLSIKGPPSLPTLPTRVPCRPETLLSSSLPTGPRTYSEAGRQLEAAPGLRVRLFGNRSIPLFSAHIASHSFLWKDSEEGAYFLASSYRSTLPSLRILFISNEEFRRAVRPSPSSLWLFCQSRG